MGGWGEVSAALATADPNLLSWSGGMGWTATSIASILGLSLIGLGFLGSPQIFVRFLALRDESEISKGTMTAIVWTIIADGGAVMIGLRARFSLGLIWVMAVKTFCLCWSISACASLVGIFTRDCFVGDDEHGGQPVSGGIERLLCVIITSN